MDNKIVHRAADRKWGMTLAEIQEFLVHVNSITHEGVFKHQIKAHVGFGSQIQSMELQYSTSQRTGE
jgi:hypothetical protein